MKIIILTPVYNDWQSVYKLVEEINNLSLNKEFEISVYIFNDYSNHDRPDFEKNLENINSVKIFNRWGVLVFETDDYIVNYLWSSNDQFIYVITKEWSSEYKKIENKTDHPLEIDKLPFRFDTTGVIYNKRFHI